MSRSFKAGEHTLGIGNPCFIIAEAGVNHNGSMDLAEQLIDAAVEAGADAVKFQTFKAKHLVTKSAPMASYQQSNMGHAGNQFDMLKKLELDSDCHERLIAYCQSRGITFLSTPFSIESADLLTKYSLPLLKIPSGEITNIPFLKHVAQSGLPLILSTGMSLLGEIEKAIQTLEAEGSTHYALLHCVSNYPASFESVNLRAMATLRSAFGCPIGFSDHTLGIEVPIAAAALGANIIEKHFTTNRSLSGPDHKASLEPNQLKAMVQGVRNIELALGDGIKRPQPEEKNTAAVARKSIVAAHDIPKTHTIESHDLRMLRPGTGLAAECIPMVVGRKARRRIQAGELLSLEMLA